MLTLCRCGGATAASRADQATSRSARAPAIDQARRSPIGLNTLMFVG